MRTTALRLGLGVDRMRLGSVGIGCLIVLALLSGCREQAVTTESPEEVAEAYVAARQSGQWQAVEKLLTEYARDHVDAPATQAAPGILNLSVGESEPVRVDDTMPAHWESYVEVRRVTATYGTPGDGDNYPSGTSEPIIVVRESPSAPWRVELGMASE